MLVCLYACMLVCLYACVVLAVQSKRWHCCRPHTQTWSPTVRGAISLSSVSVSPSPSLFPCSKLHPRSLLFLCVRENSSSDGWLGSGPQKLPGNSKCNRHRLWPMYVRNVTDIVRTGPVFFPPLFPAVCVSVCPCVCLYVCMSVCLCAWMTVCLCACVCLPLSPASLKRPQSLQSRFSPNNTMMLMPLDHLGE
jgi:hypothetical protein